MSEPEDLGFPENLRKRLRFSDYLAGRGECEELERARKHRRFAEYLIEQGRRDAANAELELACSILEKTAVGWARRAYEELGPDASVTEVEAIDAEFERRLIEEAGP